MVPHTPTITRNSSHHVSYFTLKLLAVLISYDNIQTANKVTYGIDSIWVKMNNVLNPGRINNPQHVKEAKTPSENTFKAPELTTGMYLLICRSIHMKGLVIAGKLVLAHFMVGNTYVRA